MAPSIPSMEGSHVTLTDNTIIVVFGASGDLAKKKTFPALFGLYRQGFLPKNVRIVGYARTKMDDAEFKSRETSYIKNAQDEKIKAKLDEFTSLSSYISGPYDQDSGFQNLEKHLAELESKHPDKNEKNSRLFYFALPPSVFIPVAQGVKKNNNTASGITRLIIEKPFGSDTESCRVLISAIKAEWSEDDTFRIDHYLGKEMVKNILLFRFANIAINAGWDNNNISNVQISFKEPFGTEGRGGYFDEFGMIRDVLQNHLLQVLTIIAMERPVSFAAEDIRDEKVKILRAIRPVTQEDILLGQYTGANGKPGYLEDDTVPKGSVCPTFAAATLYIQNPRWDGVPFILKAGKALNEAKVEVRIQYKDVTQGIFNHIGRNELVFRIQPNEAIYVKINNKSPGFDTKPIPIEMDLTYKRRFTDLAIPEAYESLILDAIKGDHSNFVRDDELDAAWKIFTPILHWIDGKKGPKPTPRPYPYGSRGPAELDSFIEARGYQRSSAGYVWPVTNLASL